MASSAESAETRGGSAAALEGRIALITGASRGIGRAIAERFARAGATLLLVARGEEALRESARANGGEPIAADVTDAESVERLRSRCRHLTGASPDFVINAAGAFHLARLADTPLEWFDAQLQVNLRAPFLLLRAFLPDMLARGSGHVISLGSVAGRAAFPDNGAYSASKFGLRGLHAVLDAELKGSGVRATLVEPAATDTPLWEAIDREAHPELPARAVMMPARAVADAVYFAATAPAEVAIRNIVLERS